MQSKASYRVLQAIRIPEDIAGDRDKLAEAADQANNAIKIIAGEKEGTPEVQKAFSDLVAQTNSIDRFLNQFIGHVHDEERS